MQTAQWPVVDRPTQLIYIWIFICICICICQQTNTKDIAAQTAQWAVPINVIGSAHLRYCQKKLETLQLGITASREIKEIIASMVKQFLPKLTHISYTKC